jgi:thioredoxin 1
MGTVKNITDDNFDIEVSGSKGITLVDFWAPWCGPCKMMAPVYEKAAEKFNKIKFCKINTDENQIKPNEAGITGIPCIIVYKDGKEIDRLIGYRGQKDFEAALTQLGK